MNTTKDTPQFHQCGFIAQSSQQIEELNHAVIGGEMSEQGQDTIRCFSYHEVCFLHAPFKQYKN